MDCQIIIEKIKAVRLQISSICNLAGQHRLCPAHICRVVEPRSMPRRLITSIVNQLLRHRYSGEIGFHTYNDPLCDCRLLSIIEEIRRKCGNKILVYTNGEYLTDSVIRELQDLRVSVLVTTYDDNSRAMAKRRGLDTCEPGFDDRLLAYTRKESGCTEPCGAPYSQLIVDVDGNVNLCCFDWASSAKFGNLNTESLHDVLTSNIMAGTAKELASGVRTRYNICRRCNTHR